MKIKNFFTVITVVILFSFFSLDAEAVGIFRGEGTKENPYLIETKEDLFTLAEQVNAGNRYENLWFRQSADIDLEEEVWCPIGICNSDNYFYGIYDGAGHTITNLKIEDNEYGALFGTLGGVVINLGIDNAVIKAPVAAGISCYAAKNSATIINCYSKADVTGETVGGISVDFYGRIYNCWSDCIIEGEAEGGITVYEPLEIYNCYSRQIPVLYTNRLIPNVMQVSQEELYSQDSCNALNAELYTRNIGDQIGYQDYVYWNLDEQLLQFGMQEPTRYEWVKQNKVKCLMLLFLVCIGTYFTYQLMLMKKRGDRNAIFK